MDRVRIAIILLNFLSLIGFSSGCEEEVKSGQWQDMASDSDSAGDSDSDSDSDDDIDSDDDTEYDDDSDSENSDICHHTEFNIEAAPVRLMILQDISGSMVTDEQGNPLPPPTKWDQAKQAIATMVNEAGSDIELGFDIFPNNGMCGVNQPPISDCKLNNSSKITGSLSGIAPDGATPLLLAMRKYLNPQYAPAFTSPDATSYLLVVSDGGDTCGNGLFPATPAQLGNVTTQLRNAEIRTFAIGFGSGTDEAQLKAVAKAGDTGYSSYIDAQDGTALEKALKQIAAEVVSCVYDIEGQGDNVDMDDVNFYFDNEVVGMDHECAQGKGWTWVDESKTSVEFCKEACDKLQHEDVKKISATFGCPTVVVQ